VVFGSRGLIIHDLLAETNGFVHEGGYATVSADGRFVAITGGLFDPLRSQVFVKDRQSGVMELVTVSTTGAPATPQVNYRPIISGDGRFVVFGGRVSNLVLNDTNNLGDVFVRDRLLGVTMLISRNPAGGAGNAASAVRPVMAADGRTVVFHSMASDLIAGDYNDKRDLFVLKLGGADTDSDGMDDDWEVAYFGNLSRDGFADFDGDGVMDRAEFLAGTDPTNAGSVFRVLTVAPVGGGSTRLFWTGNPNRSYRAEFKDNIDSGTWSPLTGAISWEGGTASILDDGVSNSMRRFYRVVRLP
jgi:Tol biopolymer transport system component